MQNLFRMNLVIEETHEGVETVELPFPLIPTDRISVDGVYYEVLRRSVSMIEGPTNFMTVWVKIII